MPWLHNPQETVLSTLSEKDSFFFSPETTQVGGGGDRGRGKKILEWGLRRGRWGGREFPRKEQDLP